MFNPQHYLSDPMVLAMNLEERGAYSTLLLGLWLQPEPGVVVADARVLATLSRATTEEWARVVGAVSRAFDTTERPGFWVQKRMVGTHKRQIDWARMRSEAGKRGNAIRWHDERKIAKRSQTDRKSIVVMGMVMGKSKSKEVSTSVQSGEGSAPAFTIPVKGGLFGIGQDVLEGLKATYPSVNVENQLAMMADWCKANPGKQKTMRGAMRFVTGWLRREQKAPKKPNPRARSDAEYAETNLKGGTEP